MFVKLGSPGRKNKAETIVIHDYDTWNVDVTLAHIIVPLLKQLKERKLGAHSVDNEDVSNELRASDEDLHTYSKNGETDKHFFDRWDYVIDEMIWAFQQKLEEWEEQFASGEHDYKFVEDPDNTLKDEEGQPMYKMEYGPNNTFEIDIEGMKKFQARMSNGYKLFGKYYEGLWD